MEIVQGAYSEVGVVLHTTKYGEGQLIVHLITQNHARRSYITRVARKDSSRSLFQPLFLIEFESGAAKGDLHKMSQVRLNPPLQSIPYSTPKSAVTIFIAELLYRVVKDEACDVFDMVKSMIVDLDQATNSTIIANFHLYFMVRLAMRLGYAPQLNFSAGSFFDIKNGYFTITPPTHPLYMNEQLSALLYDLSVSDVSGLSGIGISRVVRRDFLNALVDYYAYHTEAIRYVRSISYLAELF